MNPVLLKSQLEALEEPLEDAVTVDTTRNPVPIVVGLIRAALKI
jgi:gluconate kinase